MKSHGVIRLADRKPIPVSVSLLTERNWCVGPPHLPVVPRPREDGAALS